MHDVHNFMLYSKGVEADLLSSLFRREVLNLGSVAHRVHTSTAGSSADAFLVEGGVVKGW